MRFIRHAHAAHNVIHVCNDDPALDKSLTDIGIQQAKTLAQALLNEPIDVIITSEYPRALDTAHIIDGGRGLPIVIDTRISERKTGGFNGKPSAEFRQKMHDSDSKSRDGESFNEERSRVLNFLEDLEAARYRSVLVVTHHEPLKIINKKLKGAKIEESIDHCVPITHIF